MCPPDMPSASPKFSGQETGKSLEESETKNRNRVSRIIVRSKFRIIVSDRPSIRNTPPAGLLEKMMEAGTGLVTGRCADANFAAAPCGGSRNARTNNQVLI